MKDAKLVGTVNGDVNINNGTVNNIILVGYGKEDMRKIDTIDLLKGIKSGFNSTLNLIDTIHFNPKYPEYHNVYISSMKNKYAMMYDGSNWTLVMKDDLIDKLYDNKRDYIEENLDDFLDSLTVSQRNALHRWMNADDDHPYIEKIKNGIKLLLYKRSMPLSIETKTINKYDKNNLISDLDNSHIKVVKLPKDAPNDTITIRRRDSSLVRPPAKRHVKPPAKRLGTKRKNIK